MFKNKKIKTARKQLGLSVESLAFQIGKLGRQVTRQTIENWEKGLTKPDAESLGLLSMALEKPVSYFFDQKANQTCLGVGANSGSNRST